MQQEKTRIKKDPGTGLYVNIPARIREMFGENRFFRYMNIRLDNVSCGHSRISLETIHDRFSNHRNVLHGGVIAAVSNAVLPLTALTIGKKTRTLSSNIVFVRNSSFDSTIYVEGFVENVQKQLITISAQVTNAVGKLMATVEATLEVTGTITGIPENWSTPEIN